MREPIKIAIFNRTVTEQSLSTHRARITKTWAVYMRLLNEDYASSAFDRRLPSSRFPQDYLDSAANRVVI